MATHHGYRTEITFRQEALKRWRTYFLGNGQLLRYYRDHCPDLAAPLMKNFSKPLVLVALELLCCLLGFGLLLIAPDPWPKVTMGILAASALAALIKRKVVGSQLKSAIWVNLNVCGLVWGYFRPVPDPSSYPLDKVLEVAARDR